MKDLKLFAGFLGILYVLATISGSAYASTTATLQLIGNVPQILNVSVDPASAAGNLDLTENATDLLVGELTAMTNSFSGFSITATSTNDFELVNSGASNAKVPYTLIVGTVVVSSGDQIVRSIPGTETHDIKITYIGNSMYDSGTYNDTVTFTITSP